MPEQEHKAPTKETQDSLGTESMGTETSATSLEAAGIAAINPVIIIPPVAIAVIMSFLLALVYGVTEEPIYEAKRADKRKKLSAVMPTFENDPLDLEEALTDVPAGKAGNVMLYTGTVEDGVSGYGITSAVGTGYSGYFSVVFGLDIEGNINKVKILETMETPGLGSKAGEPDFIDQFNGKDPDSFNFAVIKDGGTIDAVTGATITSRAICDAVKQGLEEYEKPRTAEPETDGGAE